MEVEQVYSIVNEITAEVTGNADLVEKDLSNIVDVGKEVLGATDVDNYVGALTDKIAKVVFINRPYSGNVPSVMMDSWEYGAVVEKVTTELPEASENESWALEDKTEYNPNVFYQPKVDAKFFNNKVTFEIDLSFTEKQVKESFNSASEINSFMTMLYNSVENSFTVKLDGLIMQTINSMIGETIDGGTAGINAVNLLDNYNTETGNTLSVGDALKDSNFLKFASMKMTLYVDRLSKISSLFNVGGKKKFTPRDALKVVMLSDFKASANSYLQAVTYNEKYTQLPEAETVPFWQGSGQDYGFANVSKINVVTGSGKTVEQSGILGVMFDREALGVTNLDKRVTTHFNAKGEFYNNFFKLDCGVFNDVNENFVVFYIAETGV
jgi:hypothetical protein